MKKLIAILTLAAFVWVPSLPAGEGSCCGKDKAGEKGKGGCPAGDKKKDCCPKDGGQKECPAGKEKQAPAKK